MNYLQFSGENRLSMSYGWQLSTRADTPSTCAGGEAVGMVGCSSPWECSPAHSTGWVAPGHGDTNLWLGATSPVTASLLPYKFQIP